MALEITGIILAASHLLTIGLLILWFGLGKPKSVAQFWSRFKQDLFGVKGQ